MGIDREAPRYAHTSAPIAVCNYYNIECRYLHAADPHPHTKVVVGGKLCERGLVLIGPCLLHKFEERVRAHVELEQPRDLDCEGIWSAVFTVNDV